MSETKDEYDFSDYPTDHPLYDETNKKVIGKLKDECAGAPIAEYIGLRPKLYSVLRTDEQLIKKAKGTKKYVIKKQINFENYKDALFNKQTYTHQMNILRSVHHKIYGLTINKTTLSPLDTKRYTAPMVLRHMHTGIRISRDNKQFFFDKTSLWCWCVQIINSYTLRNNIIINFVYIN